MQTEFSADRLGDPQIAAADAILRKCVHCGFCTATCPTYVLLGDELDSPRGRIYLIKDMLEKNRDADAKTVKHIDRCLSCLSCMTTCPSGVNYMNLVDQARAHIHNTYKRPLSDQMLRSLLAFILPRTNLFRLSLLGAKLVAPLAPILPGRLRGLIAMAPKTIPTRSPGDRPQIHRAIGKTRKRVALLTGCAQPALDPAINEATIRLLTRHGVEVIIAKGAGCCGALTHHMGMEPAAHHAAARNINAWCNPLDQNLAEPGQHDFKENGLDHVIINTSGCGTTVKNYGYMFRNDPELSAKAAWISSITLDVSELMTELSLQIPAPSAAASSATASNTDQHQLQHQPQTPPSPPSPAQSRLKIAYHSACSLQHGQKITDAPRQLLEQAGFEVLTVPESHLCCGSAGTYNLLQPELASALRARKVGNIKTLGADAVAAGNLGCIIQIAGGIDLPVLHSVQLLDWATGGPKPSVLANSPRSESSGTI